MCCVQKCWAIQKNDMIAGDVGFLLVTRNGRPRTHSEYADAILQLTIRYNEAGKVKIDRYTRMYSVTHFVQSVLPFA